MVNHVAMNRQGDDKEKKKLRLLPEDTRKDKEKRWEIIREREREMVRGRKGNSDYYDAKVCLVTRWNKAIAGKKTGEGQRTEAGHVFTHSYRYLCVLVVVYDAIQITRKKMIEVIYFVRLCLFVFGLCSGLKIKNKY